MCRKAEAPGREGGDCSPGKRPVYFVRKLRPALLPQRHRGQQRPVYSGFVICLRKEQAILILRGSMSRFPGVASPKTISIHVENVPFYINEYLLRNETLTMDQWLEECARFNNPDEDDDEFAF